MIKHKSLSRRRLLKGAGAAGAMTITGFPAISYAQADVIKIGHLTPRTGFLGPLGEYAVQAVDLAVEEINAAGGVNGRKIELLKEDSVNPQTASTKAERMIERDKVACIIGEISSASGLTIAQVAERTKTLFVNTGANSDAAARQELQASTCSTSSSQNSMYVKTVRPLADGAGPGQGQEVVLAHRRLRLRPRPAEGRQALHGGQWRPVRRRQAGADRCDRLLGAAARDPHRQARPRDLEPRRQPDHQLPQAVFGIRPRPSRSRASASTPRSPGPPARTTSSAPGRWSGTT